MYVPMLITDFVRRAVKQYSKKVGIVDGEKRFTYAEFGERVNRLSSVLLSLGIEKGDRVATIEVNTHRLLEMFYAVPQIGAILLPINMRLSSDEIAYIINNAEAKCLILSEDMADLIEPVKDKLKTIEHYILMRDEAPATNLTITGDEYESLLQQSSPVLEKTFDLDERDPAEMFYTSGTTGRPKGVLLTHRNIYINALNYLYAESIKDSSILLHCIPLFHANGWCGAHNLTWVGGRHIMLRQFRAEVVCDLIQKERVTYMHIVPTMANTLAYFEDITKYDLSSVERVSIGGAPLSRAVHEAIRKVFRPDCIVCAGYGLTETVGGSNITNIKDYLSELPEEERRKKTCKSALPSLMTEIRVINENGEDVKPDGEEIGEVVMRGNNITDGYWQLPEETEKAFKGGWFHTGDLGTIDEEGYIQIVDRAKDLIISGGENISSIEIENAIYSHPAVLEVAVVAAPHEKWGETPVAIVVLKGGESLTQDELVDYLRTKLARFKVPKLIEFRDSLPKGGAGKIMKRELREAFWTGHDTRVG